MLEEKFFLEYEPIKLGQLIKLLGMVNSGAESKKFIENNKILLNSKIENKKGKKIYFGDRLCINENFFLILKKEVKND